MNPMPNKKSATRLSANILNYFAVFTETRFNFRTIINCRWTNNELTLDLSILQDLQDVLLQKMKTGDNTPIIIAFANGAVGELIFGVNDKSRDIVGIENSYNKLQSDSRNFKH